MATDPDDLDRDPIRGRPLDNDLRDQAPQQGLALVVAESGRSPTTPGDCWLRCSSCSRSSGVSVGLCGCLGKAFGGLFGLAEGAQLVVPVAFEFGGRETVLRVDLLIAAAGQVGADSGPA